MRVCVLSHLFRPLQKKILIKVCVITHLFGVRVMPDLFNSL